MLANSHELDLRILSLILIALESHDLTRRPPRDRQMVSSIYALVYTYYVYLYRYNRITYSKIFTFAAFQLVSVGLNRITGTQWCRYDQTRLQKVQKIIDNCPRICPAAILAFISLEEEERGKEKKTFEDERGKSKKKRLFNYARHMESYFRSATA